MGVDLPVAPGSPSLAVLPRPSTGVAIILAAALAATLAPLLTYGLTLAAFGGAHVFAELRYVEARFSARLGRRLAWAIGVGLVAVAVLRLGKVLDWWGGVSPTRIELAVVAGLGGLVLPTLAAAGALPLAVGALVVAAIGVGLWWAPIWTVLLLACLHNWTPVGFFLEGLPRAERSRARWAGLLAFLVVPASIASGVPAQLGRALGAWWPGLTLLPTGPLSANLGAYLPSELHGEQWAVAAFSALVFAQCMHYVSVIGLLPRIAPGGPDAAAIVGLSRVPRGWFVGGVAVGSVLAFGAYALDFKGTRAWYGVIAAVHAWVEVPLLLLALVPMSAQTRPRPPTRGFLDRTART